MLGSNGIYDFEISGNISVAEGTSAVEDGA